MRNHTRVVRGLAVGAALTGLLASSVSAATTTVNATAAKTFVARDVTAAVGGSIKWVGNAADEHSATQNALLFDSGPEAFSLNFTRAFSAGTFPYHCRKHGTNTTGMRGTVTVKPQVLAAPAGLPFTVRWARASGALQTGTRFDVRYKVGAGAEKVWLTNTVLRSKVFGANASPVKLVSGKKYSFRVVSRTGARKSGFSPAVPFIPR